MQNYEKENIKYIRNAKSWKVEWPSISMRIRPNERDNHTSNPRQGKQRQRSQRWQRPTPTVQIVRVRAWYRCIARTAETRCTSAMDESLMAGSVSIAREEWYSSRDRCVPAERIRRLSRRRREFLCTISPAASFASCSTGVRARSKRRGVERRRLARRSSINRNTCAICTRKLRARTSNVRRGRSLSFLFPRFPLSPFGDGAETSKSEANDRRFTKRKRDTKRGWTDDTRDSLFCGSHQPAVLFRQIDLWTRKYVLQADLSRRHCSLRETWRSEDSTFGS